jgi:thiamine-phosphate pyrophosphorylase
VSSVDKPVIAIGGIDSATAADVLSTGAWGIAVLSAVVTRADPAASTAEIRAAIDTWIGHEVSA